MTDEDDKSMYSLTIDGETDSLCNYGWGGKSCYYFNHLFDYIDIPSSGNIIQIGVALGCSLEVLHQRFGDRVIGIDPWNPLDHPRVLPQRIQDTPDMPSAFIHCNAGDFRYTPELRREALEWSLRNLVPGGVCLTAGNNEYVESLLGFTTNEIATKHKCTIEDIPTEIRKQNNPFNTDSDCLIYKT